MNEYEIMIKNLENRVTELEKLTVCRGASTLAIKKWQPKGGDWWVDAEGEVVKVETSGASKDFGTERHTEEQAQRAAVEMRRFNRLLALRDELCGDDVPTLESSNISKYFIVYNGFENTWDVSAMYKGFVTPCFKTEQQARRACDMLNSGEVEL
jgi:hypothetical protein